MLPQMIDNSRNSWSFSMPLVFDSFSSCFYSLKSSLLKSCSPSSNLLLLCFISFIFPSLFQRQSHTTLSCLGHTFSFNSKTSFSASWQLIFFPLLHTSVAAYTLNIYIGIIYQWICFSPYGQEYLEQQIKAKKQQTKYFNVHVCYVLVCVSNLMAIAV